MSPTLNRDTDSAYNFDVEVRNSPRFWNILGCFFRVCYIFVALCML